MVAFFTYLSPLSNMYPAPFILDGFQYSCTEQFIQMCKAQLFGDGEVYDRIAQEYCPHAQKKLGKKVLNGEYDRDYWLSRAPALIYPGIWQKFTQNEFCKQVLLGTGSKALAEP